MPPDTSDDIARAFTFVTDTATMCVFDLAGLRHRLHDTADWWSIPADELAEVNAGNVAFFNLGSDGAYAVELCDAVPDPQVAVALRALSGRVFLGAAEEVTAEGLEPEAVFGGAFVDLAPGNYRVLARRAGATLRIAIVPGGAGANAFSDLLRI